MSPKTQTQPPTAAAAPTTDAAASAFIPPAPAFLPPWRVIDGLEPQGFWKAVRVDPWRGTWVMQLGTDPHPANTPLTYGELIVGFQWTGYLPAGNHSFVARFANGPITANANGGTISASLFLTVDGRGPSQIAQRNSVQYLQVSRFLSYSGVHSVSLGGRILSSFQGAASPYGEIISGAEFNHFPGLSLGAEPGVQAMAAPAELSEDQSGERLFDENKIQLVEISPREAARQHLAGL